MQTLDIKTDYAFILSMDEILLMFSGRLNNALSIYDQDINFNGHSPVKLREMFDVCTHYLSKVVEIKSTMGEQGYPGSIEIPLVTDKYQQPMYVLSLHHEIAHMIHHELAEIIVDMSVTSNGEDVDISVKAHQANFMINVIVETMINILIYVKDQLLSHIFEGKDPKTLIQSINEYQATYCERTYDEFSAFTNNEPSLYINGLQIKMNNNYTDMLVKVNITF